MMLVQGSINGRIPCGSYHIQNSLTPVQGKARTYLYRVDYVDAQGDTQWRGDVSHCRDDPWYVLLNRVIDAHMKEVKE